MCVEKNTEKYYIKFICRPGLDRRVVCPQRPLNNSHRLDWAPIRLQVGSRYLEYVEGPL